MKKAIVFALAATVFAAFAEEYISPVTGKRNMRSICIYIVSGTKVQHF